MPMRASSFGSLEPEVLAAVEAKMVPQCILPQCLMTARLSSAPCSPSVSCGGNLAAERISQCSYQRKVGTSAGLRYGRCSAKLT